MKVVSNEILGIVFLSVGALGTFLMFYLWKFPFDHERMRSEAPRSLMWVHRILGYIYLALYIYFMWQMIPRLWTYQIELPARTVAHLSFGFAIGAILILKVAIVRFFKHLESTLVPVLGTALFICTFLLIGLAVPHALRESYLHRNIMGNGGLSEQQVERVRAMLPLAGVEEESMLDHLTSAGGLLAGRNVLLGKCVQCHDLRTVLARPRTPGNWRQIVLRMADRANILDPIDDDEQWEVTAYLIAISPTLQKSVQQERAQAEKAGQAKKAVELAGRAVKSIDVEAALAPYDRAEALKIFETRCSFCHPNSIVEYAPPESSGDVLDLVSRMVKNGLDASQVELLQIMRYLNETYVEQ